MLAIYDDNGTIINENTEKATIVGSLYSLEVTVPEGKILDHIDTSSTDHLAVFVDAPKSALEQLQDTVNASLGMLVLKDMNHDKAIQELQLEVKKINALLIKEGGESNE